MPEIVDHGVTGYTVPPEDPDALAESLVDLLEQPAKARAFGAAGYSRLVRCFHIVRNVSSTLSLYADVLDGGRRAERRAADTGLA